MIDFPEFPPVVVSLDGNMVPGHAWTFSEPPEFVFAPMPDLIDWQKYNAIVIPIEADIRDKVNRIFREIQGHG